MAGQNLRDQAGGDDLEDQGDPGHQRGQVAADARAHGQEAGEEGDDAEEEGDQEEGEGEPRGEEVVVRSGDGNQLWF